MKNEVIFFLRETWSLLVIFLQMVRAAWRIAYIRHPIVTVFGGHAMHDDGTYYKQAALLGERLAAENISILTGGGSGIMEAIHCGTAPHSEHAFHTILGIGIKGLDDGPNKCVKSYIEVNSFFARKYLLTYYADAFVVFPGGYGTLDELAEILTLMQTKKIPAVPIILIGVEFWSDFFAWLECETVIKSGFAAKEDLRLLTITDDLERAFCIIQRKCTMYD